jgi:hypothetical protein
MHAGRRRAVDVGATCVNRRWRDDVTEMHG